jgi:hypothetical protein
MAGYSGTPLPQKLGIKPGAIVVLIDAPEHYRKLLGQIPSGVNFATRPIGNTKFVHVFAKERCAGKSPRMRQSGFPGQRNRPAFRPTSLKM